MTARQYATRASLMGVLAAMLWATPYAAADNEPSDPRAGVEVSGSLPWAAEQLQTNTAQEGGPIRGLFRTMKMAITPMQQAHAPADALAPDAKPQPITLHDYLNPSDPTGYNQALLELDLGF